MSYGDQTVQEQYQESLEKRQVAINRISMLKHLIDQGEPRRKEMYTAIRSYKIHDGRMQRLEKFYADELEDIKVHR